MDTNQKNAYQQYQKRTMFSAKVDLAMFHDRLDDIIKVKDQSEGIPIIAVLGQDPVSLLAEHCRSMDGLGNIFVQSDDGAHYLECRKDDGDHTLANVWNDGGAPISSLLESIGEDGWFVLEDVSCVLSGHRLLDDGLLNDGPEVV